MCLFQKIYRDLNAYTSLLVWGFLLSLLSQKLCVKITYQKVYIYITSSIFSLFINLESGSDKLEIILYLNAFCKRTNCRISETRTKNTWIYIKHFYAEILELYKFIKKKKSYSFINKWIVGLMYNNSIITQLSYTH